MVTFLLNEMYPCLQGEGKNVGKPSLLVRFQICNLRCVWCDTPYTHTFKSDPVDALDPASGQKFKRVSSGELAAKIMASAQKHLIFTGGEPTLQPIHLLQRTLGKEFSIEVESNGTRVPHLELKDFTKEDYFNFQWNISPKATSAGEKIVEESLVHWAQLAKEHSEVYFKFVVRQKESEADMLEIIEIIKKFQIPPKKVFLMAEGTSVESQIKNQWLHDICIQQGFTYTPRLHVLLFGNSRGT